MNVSVCPPCAMDWIALQSQSRTRQSVEIFIGVVEFRRTLNFAGK